MRSASCGWVNARRPAHRPRRRGSCGTARPAGVARRVAGRRRREMPGELECSRLEAVAAGHRVGSVSPAPPARPHSVRSGGSRGCGPRRACRARSTGRSRPRCSSSITSGAVQASTSWTTWLRLSPSHWWFSNLVGRSIASGTYSKRMMGSRIGLPITEKCWNRPADVWTSSGTSPRPSRRRWLVGIRRWSSGRASGQPPPKSRNIHRSAGPPPFFGATSQSHRTEELARLISSSGRKSWDFRHCRQQDSGGGWPRASPPRASSSPTRASRRSTSSARSRCSPRPTGWPARTTTTSRSRPATRARSRP